MGLFSSSSESKADKKARIKAQYDSQIASVQAGIDNHKSNLEDARWQLKMTKDKSWKRTIEQEQHLLSQLKDQLKAIKENKAYALKNV